MKKLYAFLGLLGTFAALTMGVPGIAKKEEPKIILRSINNNTDNDFTIYFPFGATPWLKSNTIRKHEKKQFNVEIPITWFENQRSKILYIDDQDNNRTQLRFLLKPSTRMFKVFIQNPPEKGVIRSKREQFQIKPGFFQHNVLKVDIILQGKSPYFKESSINIIPIPTTLVAISVQNIVKRIRAGELTLESLKGAIPEELIRKIQIELE